MVYYQLKTKCFSCVCLLGFLLLLHASDMEKKEIHIAVISLVQFNICCSGGSLVFWAGYIDAILQFILVTKGINHDPITLLPGRL